LEQSSNASKTLQTFWRGRKARQAYKELKEETRQRQNELQEQKATLEQQVSQLQQGTEEGVGACPATTGGFHLWNDMVCSGCGISQEDARKKEKRRN